MARPRPPEQPDRWPACPRCTGHYRPVAVWPDGRVCSSCYRAAHRLTGRCACGHYGVLPGRIDGQPACRRCSGVRINVDCAGCGAETELYARGRCWHCTLAETVDRVLTDPASGRISPQLAPVAAALKSMSRANSGLTWIRQPHVQAFLTELAAEPTVTHQRLDRLPVSRTREHVRGLLVEHGVLPRRDDLLARYLTWAETALERLPHPDDRELLRRYLRWHQLRRLRQGPPVTPGSFLRAKQTVTVAVDLLLWLRSHGADLTRLGQADLDRWQAEGPSTRGHASRFLAWARRSHLIDPTLTLTPHRRGASRVAPAAEQRTALARVLRTEELTARDRTAAILVLVFAQPIADVVRLRRENVTVTDELVTVRPAALDIALPPPLDQPLRDLLADPGHARTAAHPDSPWLFRGGSRPAPHRQPPPPAARPDLLRASHAARHPARAHPHRARRGHRRGPRLRPRHHREARPRGRQHLRPVRRRPQTARPLTATRPTTT